MKIEINSEAIYQQLARECVRYSCEQDEEGEQRSKVDKEILALTSCLCGSLLVPYPFEKSFSRFLKEEEFYSGRFYISTIYERVYDAGITGLSEELSKFFGERFVEANSNGSGYVVAGEDILVCINGQNRHAPYEIVIGSDSAKRRKFGNIEDFISDMCEFEKVINCFVNSGISVAARERKCKIPPASLKLDISPSFYH